MNTIYTVLSAMCCCCMECMCCCNHMLSFVVQTNGWVVSS